MRDTMGYLRIEDLHVAQIGTGRVGRPTAYTILCAGLAGTMTVCDTKPGLALAFAEELRHVAVSLGLDVKINSCEKDEDVYDADIILVSAGKPRVPGVNMDRRDLAKENAKVVKQVSEVTAPRNRKAKYVMITNPVDSMAMICKKYSKADVIISTGTYLESLRFRSELAKSLDLPASKVRGWVGGEHGDMAAILWSTAKVFDFPAGVYATSKGRTVDKKGIESRVKEVSRFIIDEIGGTEYGPAASFRDIVRAMIKDTREIFSIATPFRFEELPEPVFVSIPTSVGWSIGIPLYETLYYEEKKKIAEAARAIYRTYKEAVLSLEDETAQS
jgi:malate dehydrogenase